MPLVMDIEVDAANFNEAAYLASNPDLAEAVKRGWHANGREHFNKHGHAEHRTMRRQPNEIATMRDRKLRAIEPLLRLDLAHEKRGGKYDFLTEQLRKETGISDTDAVSSNGYDPHVTDTINSMTDGRICIDIGSGRRAVYYENVVNYEIVDYDTTDVIGVGERLPFHDNSFDAAFSMAVLEHVRDPFQCAREIIRVLKPGGRLICCVPFLQPIHGYPHHYYNMSGQGLRALFDHTLSIDDHMVVDTILPIWTLAWIAQSWAAGLQGEAREQFLGLSIRDLMSPAGSFLDAPWVRELSKEKNFELASATMILAHKPISQAASTPR